MKNIFTLHTILLFLTIWITNANACVSLEVANNGDKSHPSIKHFTEIGDNERKIVVHNESDNFDCEFSFSAVELIQDLNGRYQFLNTIPGYAFDHSLVPFMDLRDEFGNSVLNQKQIVGSKQVKSYSFVFNFPLDKQIGSYHGGIKITYPQYTSFVSIVETYFTFEQKKIDIEVLKLDYHQGSNTVEYNIRNNGNAYTFVRFEVTLQDPQTGFTRSFYMSSNNKKRLFVGHIRNFPLPKEGGSTIASSFRMEGFIENLIKILRWKIQVRKHLK